MQAKEELTAAVNEVSLLKEQLDNSSTEVRAYETNTYHVPLFAYAYTMCL